MSYSPDQLLKIVANYEQLATDSLVVTAKKKEKKKLDPKAKVRNRGTVCVPAEQAKDKKDHFPINDADQARNALARVHQYTSAPEWYKGSLKGLQSLVARKVKAKYPKIDVGGKKEKKSSLEYIESLLATYGQNYNPTEQTEADIASFLKPGGEKGRQPHSKYPHIDPVYQTMLNVNPDGALGPITQSALDRYKVSVGNPGISNELAYEYLKRETEYASRKPMTYDDNSNTYVTNRQKQQAAPSLVREVPF